jgi:hypothetical protein
MQETAAAMSANLAAMREMLDSIRSSTVIDYVIECEGFYMDLSVIECGEYQPRAAGILAASVFSFKRASLIAPKIRNGNGTRGSVISRADALAREIAGAREVLDRIEAHIASLQK